MAHAAPPPPGRQKRNAVIGAVVLVVGIVLAVVAFIGLNNPKGPNSAESGSRSSSGSSSPQPSSSRSSSSPTTPPSTPPTSTRPTTTARTTPPPTSATAGPSLPLLILNNTGRPGLAALAESRFEGKGWKVTSLANYSNSDIISTCAYWDASVSGSEAAAQQLQREFPNIQRVKQRLDELPSGPIVVVLDDDYS